MEDNIGTIFYIVLTVIVLVITFLNRKKKLGAGAPKPNQGETAVTDPFQAFEMDSRETEVEMSDQMVDTEAETPAVQSKLERIMEEGSSAFDEGTSLTRQEEMGLIQDSIAADLEDQAEDEWSEGFETRQEESELEKIMKEFDLKKAVIHSEIINRKDY